MRVLEQAAAIAERGFAPPGAMGLMLPDRMGLDIARALGLTVNPGDPITGNMGWNNIDIPTGTSLIAGWGLGELVGNTFYFWGVGTDYIYGSRITTTAPSPGGSRTHAVTSWALGTDPPQKLTADVWVFVAQGSLRTMTHNNRMIGLHWHDWQNLIHHADRIYQNVLTIDPNGNGPPPPPPGDGAEVTAFSFSAG